MYLVYYVATQPSLLKIYNYTTNCNRKYIWNVTDWYVCYKYNDLHWKHKQQVAPTFLNVVIIYKSRLESR